MKKLQLSSLWLLVFALALFNQCQQPRKSAEGSLDEGAKLFLQYCSRCHSDKGMGGQAPGNVTAPDIRRYTRSAADINWIISNGYGRMPSLKDSMTAGNITSIANYVAAQIEYHSSSSNTIYTPRSVADSLQSR